MNSYNLFKLAVFKIKFLNFLSQFELEDLARKEGIYINVVRMSIKETTQRLGKENNFYLNILKIKIDFNLKALPQ